MYTQRLERMLRFQSSSYHHYDTISRIRSVIIRNFYFGDVHYPAAGYMDWWDGEYKTNGAGFSWTGDFCTLESFSWPPDMFKTRCAGYAIARSWSAWQGWGPQAKWVLISEHRRSSLQRFSHYFPYSSLLWVARALFLMSREGVPILLLRNGVLVWRKGCVRWVI